MGNGFVWKEAKKVLDHFVCIICKTSQPWQYLEELVDLPNLRVTFIFFLKQNLAKIPEEGAFIVSYKRNRFFTDIFIFIITPSWNFFQQFFCFKRFAMEIYCIFWLANLRWLWESNTSQLKINFTQLNFFLRNPEFISRNFKSI